jgi:hypothetical protein
MRREVSVIGGECDRCDEYTAIVRWFHADVDARGLCEHCLVIAVEEMLKEPHAIELRKLIEARR